MTSTVLDVTLLLLCVSASVIALGGVDGVGGGGPGSETGAYAADDAADRLATETATVTYDVTGGDHDSRTVHATLAELLVMAVEERAVAPDAKDLPAVDRFRSAAVEAVGHAMGPRTRVDVRYDAGEGSDASGTRTAGKTGALTAGEARTRTAAGRWASTVEVGPEPPADVAVSVAVVTHPASGDADGSDAGRFRILVRVW